MPQLFSEYIGVNSSLIVDNGVFDTVLDSDSRFFINFTRVKKAQTPELQDAYKRILKFFRKLGIIIQAAQHPGDSFYREANRRLNMSEFEELCLGYSFNTTAGRGSGPILKKIIISTAKEILTAGVQEPEIFELVGLFEEGIGPDRISDFIGRLIQDDLVAYSKRIIQDLQLSQSISNRVEFVDDLVLNPYNRKPVILIPRELLHELPIAREWQDIDHVCMINSNVRKKINDAVGEEWKDMSVKQKKRTFKRIVLGEISLLDKLIDDYRKFDLEEYDYKSDPLGEAIWLPLGRKYAKTYPLELSNPKEKDISWLKNIVSKICEQFKQLIELNGLNEVLYTKEGKPRPERIAQKTFQAVADTYCRANNIDISPEVNSGRGPVDFKFVINGNTKILVEVKLTTNTRLIHGYKTQLEEYKKSERTDEAFYLVIDNGGSQSKIQSLLDLHSDY
ncbi:MAG: hypothetical protein F4Y79_06035, partial [Gemmatimonadetes bacterium]|nr:hypothetical protein [Gemmatimonadota bacterium]